VLILKTYIKLTLANSYHAILGRFSKLLSNVVMEIITELTETFFEETHFMALESPLNNKEAKTSWKRSSHNFTKHPGLLLLKCHFRTCKVCNFLNTVALTLKDFSD
jgi:hypothetical protein